MSGRPREADPKAVAPLGEPLSDAELRVLRFRLTNLSAEAITNEIFVSVKPVKTHMRHFYVKLYVHSRIEAAERAPPRLMPRSARHD